MFPSLVKPTVPVPFAIVPAHVEVVAFDTKFAAPPLLSTVPPAPGITPPLLLKPPMNCVPPFRSSVAPTLSVSTCAWNSVFSPPEVSVVVPPFSVVAPV